MRMVDLIEKKKSGQKLSKKEIDFLIGNYVKKEIPDYQMSALLMAICFKNLDEEETYNLTNAMLHSGEQIDLSSIKGICIDKHSTGGVGDKTTLVVTPIVSACGLKVAKMSGRGLGHTGGTLDKLESIPGFNINLTSEEFLKQVNEIGISVIGQTANITPADKMLYALRDVTATVDNVGLIASSIMSKKLASGADIVSLDVKVGEGAFMKDLASAKILANRLVSIGKRSGKKVSATLSDMSQPLGEMVGNSVEVIEAIETLKGRGPKRFVELCVDLSCELLIMTGLAKTEDEARKIVNEKISNGEALDKLRQMIIYQKGDPKVIEDYTLFPTSTLSVPVMSMWEGYIAEINALKIGEAAMTLGAGRESKDDMIDPSVGIKVMKSVGDYVKRDEPIAVMYVNSIGRAEAQNLIMSAFTVVSHKVEPTKIILGVVR